MFVLDEAKQHAKNVNELKKRWEKVQQAIFDIRSAISLLEEKENYYKKFEVLQNEVDEIITWKEKMLSEKPSNNQLIHLRNKIRTLKQNEMKIKELNAQSIVMLTKTMPLSHKNEIENDSKRLNETFEELLAYLIKKEIEIKKAINKKSNKMDNDYNNLQIKINTIESALLKEHAMVSSEDVLTEKIDNLKEVQKDFDDLKSSYDDVVRDKKEKYAVGDRDKGMKLASSVDNLITKFSDTRSILEQKIAKLEKGKLYRTRFQLIKICTNQS